MKVYVVTEKDVEALLSAIDRNPEHGLDGGSSAALTETERKAHEQAHSFYNYHVRKWIGKIKED